MNANRFRQIETVMVVQASEEEIEASGFLYALEIENFKSFKGKHYIGPFRSFSAIIGPNGSGKSNLMDAISFVLGERSTNLRVRKLGDLIHGASVEKAEVNRCRVSMIYVFDKNDDSKRRVFTRSVISSTASEFRIDNEAVGPSAYHKALEEINIFIKAKNFLVYQGSVERVAMQNPKELTQTFEELSRSIEFKVEYDRLKNEMQAAESNAQVNLNKRRDVAMEKREAKLEKDEARKYQTLKDDMTSRNKELYLVQLYFVEHSRNSAMEQLAELREQVDEIRAQKAQNEEDVARKHAIVKGYMREVQKLEQRITKEERKMAVQQPRCNQLRQQIEHLKAKRSIIDKVCQAAKRIAEENENNIKETEAKIKKVEGEMSELQKQIQQESQKMQLQLNPEQLAEYRRLKSEVDKRCNIAGVELDDKRQEQETDRNALEYEERRLVSYQERIKQKNAEIAREEKNLESLKESEQQKEELVQQEIQNLKKLEQDVKAAKERMMTVAVELQELAKQISDAQCYSAESDRNRRQTEAIESLKRVFPDRVHGRLIDLCQPSHRKFQVAVTKVLGKFMMAVVCDTDDTARECIIYLREQHYPPETLLPLNSLDVTPLNEKLRDFHEIPNVKLVYDVITCNMPVARKALQFVCGNSLVCDTPEHARQLAFGHFRCRAVSLDGTQFHPGGVISGGGHDLKARAKRWDENTIKKLRDKKNELTEEYNILHKTRRRELDVEMKRNQIKQLEQRIKFTQTEYKRIQEHVIRRCEREREADEGEIESIMSKIESRRTDMEKRSVEIERLEAEINKIADEVFAEFCQKIGINHIREYEQRELRFHEENEKKLNTSRRELERLKYELDFLNSEDKRDVVRKEREKLEQLEKEEKEARKAFDIEQEKLAVIEASIEEIRKEIVAKRSDIEAAEAEVVEAKKKGSDVDKQLHQIEKNFIQQEQIEMRRAQKRHSLLHECKLHGIDLPLKSGSLDMILIADEFSSYDSQASASQSQTSQRSQITAESIEIDYSSLKGLKAYQNEAEVKKVVEKLTKQVQDAEAALSKMAIPSTQVNQRMEEVKSKEAEMSEECEAARKKARKARVAFEKVKAERIKRFQDFFQPVSDKIDEIYKALSQNESAQAFLGAINLEEPYADGIQYNCIAPGKRFRPMDNLSGGEKTIAALALLFAIHSSNPSPFFVLDEIDAALDNTNIGKVVSYISERSRSELQLIVISLKEEMYNKASALVGVYPKNTVPCIASGILTYDLENFND